jgi:hypothetical protein
MEGRDVVALERERIECRFLRVDGSLTLESRGADEGVSHFTYDPADPITTVGGQIVSRQPFFRGHVTKLGSKRVTTSVCLPASHWSSK